MTRMPRSCDERAARREDGFALLMVLWALALLALLVGHLIAAGRTEARIAANVVASARAEAAADGAVYEAVFRLADPTGGGWSADGSVHRIAVGDIGVAVRVRSVAGRINPNIAPTGLLSALLRALGVDQTRAQAIAAAIAGWRRSGAQFQSLTELSQLADMNPTLLQRLRPHLSLFQPTDPDPHEADPVVAAAIATWRGAPPSAESGAAAVASIPIVIIDAVASVGRAHFVRRAVVRIDAVPPHGYAVLAWNRRADDGD